MKYDYLIFDADHTVIDFDEDERRAFRAVFSAVGRSVDDCVIEDCWTYSAQNWAELGLNNVHLDAVQNTFHQTYYEHVRCLMAYLDRTHGLNGRLDEGARVFDRTLSLSAHYIQNADELIKKLSRKYRVCIATNGLTEMQHGRLQQIKPYLSGLFISEEMGVIKPNRLFFEKMLNTLGVEPSRCLMIGDSISSDVRGANCVGMDAVWFNRRGVTAPSDVTLVGEIACLEEIYRFLGE